jgi:TRAP-type C4-dicarboxylate transport system permease large subunit
MASKATRRRFLGALGLGAGSIALAACAETTATAPIRTTSAATTTTGATSAAVSQPSQAVTLKMQSTWSTKDIFHEIFVDWSKAIGGLILAAANGKLYFQNVKESVFLTIRTSAVVGWLFIGSSLFSVVFALLGGSRVIGDFVTGLGLSPDAFMWISLIIIFLLGWP